MKYAIAIATSIFELEKQVQSYLNAEWKLYGNPFSTITSREEGSIGIVYNEIQYAQAMIKENNEQS